ncbi:MAG: imidazolonepropionase [Syntrophobacterales bacterium]|nr:MAG: imidazolonepropionase [Syntrophobacterales bacterium]
MIRKLFRNASITTPSDPGTPLAGERQEEVRHFTHGAVYCRDGVIKAIGEEKEVLKVLSPGDVDIEIDCEGLCLIPGFVDPHTHMCFAKKREEEFTLRIQGTDYLEILQRGGGILSSVRAVRAASEDELFSTTLEHALSAHQFGTTTLEIKSGYGLETESELKMLRVIDRVGRETPLDVVPTFLGAHAVPEEYAKAPEDYLNLLIHDMIPAVSKQGIARFCDVFCERNVFTVDQSRRILQAAKEAGMGLKVHADEVYDLGGAGLAAELQATSAEHLLAASDENLRAMAKRGVIGVILPGTAYSLQKAYAPARKMVEFGVPVALATDCNPGSCYTESMPFVFGLAVLNMNLSVSEALVAATLNAAYAIEMAAHGGSLDVGKSADLLLLDGESPAIIAYHAGVSPVVGVYKRGELVFSP